jgi:uncharacterized membrane protein YgcG
MVSVVKVEKVAPDIELILTGRRLVRLGRLLFLAASALVVAGLADLTSLWLMSREVPTTWEEQPLLLGLGAFFLALALLLTVVGVWLQARGARQARTTPASFLSPDEERRVTDEIRRFESRSSGEIVVHLCGRSRTGSIMRDAAETFARLGLSQTRDRNAVLFFIAVRDHRFAVLGDRGINEIVPPGFWDEMVGRVERHFGQGRFGDGLVAGIDLAGEALARYFPPRPDDRNELPDAISRT